MEKEQTSPLVERNDSDDVEAQTIKEFLPPPPPSTKPIETQTPVYVVAMAVSFYFVTSLSTVFFNKIIMSNYEFPFPLFITWFQFLVALGCIGVMYAVGSVYPSVHVMRGVSASSFTFQSFYKILPLTALYVCMICFSNLTLQWSQVSFYQIARSLTIIFSMIFTYVFFGKATSWEEIKPCLVVVVGFVMGVKGELNFEPLSIVFGLTASAFLAYYAIKVKSVISDFNNDQWIVLLLNTMEALVLLLPFVFIFGEYGQMIQEPIIYQQDFWVVMVLGGIVGFLINIAMFWQIKTTSPLTSNLSGTAKACTQTALGVLIWRNQISLLNGFGILLVIGGSLWYSMVRYWMSRR